MIIYSSTAVGIIAIATITALVFKKSGPPARAKEAYMQGNRLMANEDYARASAQFTQALRAYPKDPRFLVGRGNANIALLDYPKAVDDYAAALRIDPSFVPAYVGIAWTHWLRGELSEAISNLRQAVQRDYENKKLWLQIEQMLEQSGDKEGVVKLYREPYEKYKSQLMTASSASRGDLKEKLQWFEDQYGGALLRAGDWQELLSIAKLASKRDSPSDELPHVNTWRYFRGMAENHLDMQTEAIADLRAILESDPKYPAIAAAHICEELSFAYLWTGNRSEAAIWARKQQDFESGTNKTSEE